MKTPLLLALLLAATSLAGCAKAPEPAAPAAAPAATPAATPATAEAPRTGAASGTVEAVDAGAGTITLAHGPVAALGWPGMTMAFKASPEQIASVKPGDQVAFEFLSGGGQATLTRIAPAR